MWPFKWMKCVIIENIVLGLYQKKKARPEVENVIIYKSIE